MPSATYSQLPTTDIHDPELQERTSIEIQHLRLQNDPRFNTPPPSRWKRAALIFFILGLLVLGIRMRMLVTEAKKPQVAHADRYSEKFKYRPAASPVITEKMKDGRLLVRGAFRGEL